MNLLNLLLKSLLTDASVSALAKKTGLNAGSLKKLIPLAVPLLLKFLTSNASSESGALSLLGALSQHTNQKTLSDQIDEADTEDGGKIIGHIFGNQSEAVTNRLAQQSGMSERDVSSALAGLAPALMSGLSAATHSVSSAPKVDLSDGFDLSDLMVSRLSRFRPSPPAAVCSPVFLAAADPVSAICSVPCLAPPPSSPHRRMISTAPSSSACSPG